MAKGNHLDGIERRPIQFDPVIVGKGIFAERLKETCSWIPPIVPWEVIRAWVTAAIRRVRPSTRGIGGKRIYLLSPRCSELKASTTLVKN